MYFESLYKVNNKQLSIDNILSNKKILDKQLNLCSNKIYNKNKSLIKLENDPINDSNNNNTDLIKSKYYPGNNNKGYDTNLIVREDNPSCNNYPHNNFNKWNDAILVGKKIMLQTKRENYI